ncbi:UNVERIFIED_CONTAM: hypothetical protein K2H54_073404 [Gekko kuhli]
MTDVLAGMDKTFCNKMEYMTDYFDKINFFMYEGPAPRIRAWNTPKDFYTFDSEGIVKNLTCKKPDQHFKAYLTPDLPKRFHYVNNIRIDKVHLMVDRQWLAVRTRSYKYCGGGNHGYDNEFKSMEAIFVAHGPGFKEKTEVQPFENIELYNLMCDTSGCVCDSITDLEALNQRLNLNNEEIQKTEAYNLPYGRPYVLQKQSTYCLLHHNKYISGYSHNIWMPLWNSYTVDRPSCSVRS